MPEVICPPIPGAFSALGLVGTDMKRDYVRTFYTTTDTVAGTDMQAAFAELEAIGSAMLDRAAVPAERRRLERSVDARYARQSYEISVPVPDGPITDAIVQELAEAFHDRHRQTYGHDNRAEPVQIVNVRVAAVGAIPALKMRQEPGAGDPVKSNRQVWFRGAGEVATPILDRALMPAGFALNGPAIIESLESTILVPPNWSAQMDDDGFIFMKRAAE